MILAGDVRLTSAGKPWSYVPIPHAVTAARATLDALSATSERQRPQQRYTEEEGSRDQR